MCHPTGDDPSGNAGHQPGPPSGAKKLRFPTGDDPSGNAEHQPGPPSGAKKLRFLTDDYPSGNAEHQLGPRSGVLKLCLLTGEYPPMQGGIADHTWHLARHLSGMDVQVSILTSVRAAGGEPSRQVALLPVVTGWGLGCWRQISRHLAEHKPDILHVQYQAAAYDLTGWVNWLPWRMRSWTTRPRLVVTFHDLRVPYLFPKAGRLRERSVLALARYSDAVIVTNVEDEQVLRRHRWATHVHRIPLGSNIEVQPPPDYDRRSWRGQLGVDESQLLVAYFGFLNQSKGGEELVSVLERLLRGGHPARLLMIGGQVGDVDSTNRAYLEQVRALIRQRGLQDRVHWTGHTSPAEVSANLLAADVVVMPYRDGVSFRRTTFIAALRHGCPVITTPPAVELPELHHGDNVLFAPVGDVEAMADAAARVGIDAALAQRLRAGAAALGRTFDWDEIAQHTYQAYRALGA